MRFLTARSLALVTLVPALLVFLLVPGCSQQGEGERCGDTYGAAASNDCGDGLTCTASGSLLNGSTDLANRCCYTDGHVTDSRCQLAGPTAAAGAGGNGGASTAGNGGASTAGNGGASTAGGATGTEAGLGGEGG